MKESNIIWKTIPEFTNYEVSNTGLVRNALTQKVISTHSHKPTKNGVYLRVTLYKNNIKRNRRVHRLVAQAFIGNPNNYPHVNHIDLDKLNNNYLNLEWCTEEYNREHYSKNSI